MRKALLISLLSTTLFVGCGNDNTHGPLKSNFFLEKAELQANTNGYGKRLILEPEESFVLHGKLDKKFAASHDDINIKIYAINSNSLNKRKILLDEIYLSNIKENPFFISYMNAPTKIGEYNITLCTKDKFLFNSEICYPDKIFFKRKLTIHVQ